MTSLSLDQLSYIVRDNDLQSILVNTFLNGIYATIVSVTVYSSVSMSGWRSLRGWMMLIMFTMYTLAVINLAQDWAAIRRAFIQHGDTSLTVFKTLRNTPPSLNILGLVCFDLNIIIADCVVMWRCWAMWSRNWKVLVVPAFLLLVEAAFSFWDIVIEADPDSFSPVLLDKLIFVPEAQIALSLALTLITTALNIYKIYDLGGLRKYSSVAEILIESAVLYSLATIFYLTFMLTPTYSNAIPGAVLEQVTGIAPALIIARVRLGLSRPVSTAQTRTAPMSVLDFANSYSQNQRASTSRRHNDTVSTGGGVTSTAAEAEESQDAGSSTTSVRGEAGRGHRDEQDNFKTMIDCDVQQKQCERMV